MINSHILNQRKRLSLTGVLTHEGFHMENEKFLNERRIKIRFFRHFNYFGPRGELFFYTVFLLGVSRLIKNNLQRENIEENLNDNNTFLLLSLPLNSRTIESQNNK